MIHIRQIISFEWVSIRTRTKTKGEGIGSVNTLVQEQSCSNYPTDDPGRQFHLLILESILLSVLPNINCHRVRFILCVSWCIGELSAVQDTSGSEKMHFPGS